MSFGFGFALPAYPLRGGGGNNPFNQTGPTLDLSFVDGATNVGNQLGADTFTLDTNFITPQYQVAAQYAVWVDGSGMTQRNFADIVTFTRGSNATQFDSTGSLVYAPVNLLTWSEDFGNAAWNKVAVNVATNSTTAPDNSLSADTITETTATDQHLVGASIAGGVFVGQVITLSCFVKIATGTRNVFLTAFGEGYSVFNPSTGAVIQTGGNTCTAISYGNGWWRFSATITKTNTNAGVFIGLWNGTNNYTGDGTSGLFIWGAQTSLFPTLGGITSSLTTYYPTTTTAYYGPRFDYNPSTLAAQGLLIEEQRTNSIRNNTMQGAVAGTPGTPPTNWSFSTGGATTVQLMGTGTENGITYVDYRFQGTGAADTWNLIYDSSIVAANGQTWTGSIYLKLVGGSTANLPFIQRLVFRDSGFANIQSIDSSALTPTGAGLATQRNTISLTATQATTAFVTLQLNGGTPTGAYNITLRIGLPQLELGAFATSVIPTTTTALTRSVDVAFVNTLSPWYNATSGTLYAEILRQTTTGYPGRARFSDGTANNAIDLYYDAAANSSTFEIKSGGTPSVQIYGGGGALNTVVKAAAAWETNNAAVVYDGSVHGTDTSVVVPSGINQLRIANALTGYVRRIVYYPRRLTNADLQTITA